MSNVNEFANLEPGKIKTIKFCDPGVVTLVFQFVEDDRHFMRVTAEDGVVWGVMVPHGFQLLRTEQADELESLAARMFAPAGYLED